MFGELPATGFFIRHVRNVELSNVEIQTAKPDARPAFWLQDVTGADFFRFARALRNTVRVGPGGSVSLVRLAWNGGCQFRGPAVADFLAGGRDRPRTSQRQRHLCASVRGT